MRLLWRTARGETLERSNVESRENRDGVAVASSSDRSRRVAFITGAGSGMGQACAIRLARSGYRIAAADINGQGLEATKSSLATLGSECMCLQIDVSEEAEVEAAMEEVGARYGPPYVLALAAGIYQEAVYVVDVTTAQLDRIFRVNVYAPVYCVRSALSLMIEGAQGGRIILWSSTGAHVSRKGFAAYCASKAAVESLVRTLACELGVHGITVNAIVPGTIDTPMIAGTDMDTYRKLLPARYVAGPEEVAGIVEFLCTSDARYITGSGIVVDGGFLAMHRLASL